MTKVKMIILSLFLSTNLWAQSFQFVPEQCAVVSQQDIQFMIGNESFTSAVEVEFVFTETLPLPKIRLRFMQHEPDTVKIRWENILTQRRGVPFFSEEVLTQILQEESQYFLTNQINSSAQNSTFETETLDLFRSQNMVALFLSQTQMTVSVINDFGDEWQGKVTLRASDASYRQMVSQCHTQRTSSYLLPTGERRETQESLGQAVSDGYGMVGFHQLSKLLPPSLRTESFFELGEVNDSTQVVELLTLLQQKQELLLKAKSESKEARTEVIAEKLKQLASERQRLSDELLLLSGAGGEGLTGLIVEKQKQEESLKIQLASITQQIQAQESQSGPLTAEAEQIQQTVLPFLPQMEEFDQRVILYNSKIEEIGILQKRLMSVAQETQALLAAKISELESATAISSPWSVEELDKNIAELNKNKNQYLLIQSLKDSLVEIQKQSTELIEMARLQKAAAEKYLLVVAQQGQWRRELSQIESEIEQGSKIPNISSIDSVTIAILNSNIEDMILAEAHPQRDYETEFSFYEKIYERYQLAFSQLLEAAKSKGSLLMAQVVCEPSVLLNPDQSRRSCLMLDELLDDSLREAFVNNLSPKDLDLLLNNVPTPWVNDLSKTELVARQLQDEIKSSQELSMMESSWLDLRHIIWRWSTMQKEASALDVCEDPARKDIFSSGLYTSQYYEFVFQCEQQRMVALVTKKSEVTQKMIVSSLDVVAANDDYKKQDQEFSKASEVFVSQSLGQIKTAQSEAVLSAIFTSCLIPLESAETCAQSIEGELQKTTIFEQKAMELVLNIQSRVLLLDAETKGFIEQVKIVEDSKQQFMVANNIAPLFARQSEIQNQMAEIEKQVADLQQLQAGQNQALTKTNEERLALLEREKALVAELTMVTLQTESVKFQQKDYCKSREIMRDQLLAIDDQLFQLFGKANTDGSDSLEAALLGLCR